MSDNSETVEDTKNGSLAEVTDDSCTLEFIEIVPLDRPSDNYHTSEFIDPVAEVKPEDLQEMKQEPADENYNADSHYYVKPEPDDEYEPKGPCIPVQVNNLYAFLLFFYLCKATRTMLNLNEFILP